MSKVKLDVLRPWISKKITDILHIEDDVVVEFVYNQLEEEKVSVLFLKFCRCLFLLLIRLQYPCPKKMQINMTGFLNGKNARQFMDELWALLLSAQESDTGIPSEFIQQKKDEILKREEDNKLLEQIKLENNDIDKSRDRGRASPSKEQLVSRSKSKSMSPIDVNKFSKSPEKQVKEVTRTSVDKSKIQRKSIDGSELSKDRTSALSPKPKSVEKSKEQRQPKANSKERIDAKSKDRKKSLERERSKERIEKPRERKRSRSRRKSKDRKRSRDRLSNDRSRKSRDRRSRSRQRSIDKSRDIAKRRSSRSPRPRRRTRSRSITPKPETRYRRSSMERKYSKRNKSKSPLRRKRSPSEQNGTKSSSGDITKIQAKLLNMAESNASKSTRSVSPVQVDKSNSTKRDKSTSRSISK